MRHADALTVRSATSRSHAWRVTPACATYERFIPTHVLLVQLSKTSTFFTDHAPTSSNGTAAITAHAPEVEVELAPHDDQDEHHQPDVDRAPQQHERAEGSGEQHAVGRPAGRGEAGERVEDQRAQEDLQLGVEEPALGQDRLRRDEEDADDRGREPPTDTEAAHGRVQQERGGQAGTGPDDREDRTDRTAGQLHDGGGEEVEERRLAVQVEDAGERVVVQQPDVEQLVGVVQQAVVEPDAGGETRRRGRRTKTATITTTEDDMRARNADALTSTRRGTRAPSARAEPTVRTRFRSATAAPTSRRHRLP